MIRQERELKFDIARGDVAELEAHPLLAGAESSAHKRLRSVYFDTDDDDIWEAGAVLRVRHEDDRKVQTIKSGGWPAHRCNETRSSTTSRAIFPSFRRRAAPASNSSGEAPDQGSAGTEFEVAVERSIWTIHFDSAELEISLDRGKIWPPLRRPISAKSNWN